MAKLLLSTARWKREPTTTSDRSTSTRLAVAELCLRERWKMNRLARGRRRKSALSRRRLLRRRARISRIIVIHVRTVVELQSYVCVVFQPADPLCSYKSDFHPPPTYPLALIFPLSSAGHVCCRFQFRAGFRRNGNATLEVHFRQFGTEVGEWRWMEML